MGRMRPESPLDKRGRMLNARACEIGGAYNHVASGDSLVVE